MATVASFRESKSAIILSSEFPEIREFTRQLRLNKNQLLQKKHLIKVEE
jgi:hypothetical protein